MGLDLSFNRIPQGVVLKIAQRGRGGNRGPREEDVTMGVSWTVEAAVQVSEALGVWACFNF